MKRFTQSGWDIVYGFSRRTNVATQMNQPQLMNRGGVPSKSDDCKAMDTAPISKLGLIHVGSTSPSDAWVEGGRFSSVKALARVSEGLSSQQGWESLPGAGVAHRSAMFLVCLDPQNHIAPTLWTDVPFWRVV